MSAPFVTIGHSNRDLDEFLAMLRDAQVATLVDVRAFPRSRTNPAFNIDRLPVALAAVQIGYRHSSSLGGRRPKQNDVDTALNAFWRVQSFHNYADYALSNSFASALEELIDLVHAGRIALMCSEVAWWRCHRRIITDYLLLNGHAVYHLMAPGRAEPAAPTAGAQRATDGKITYPGVTVAL